MIQRLLLVLLVVMIPACSRPAAREMSANAVERQAATTPQSDLIAQVDVAELLREIKNCNKKELSYFYEQWSEIHNKLRVAAENKELESLPMNQQEELWDALAYLQSCRHGDIMRKHGDEMVELLFQFGTDDQLTLLRDIYPNVGRDAR